MKAAFVLVCSLLISSLSASQWTRTTGPAGAAISALTTIDGTIYAGTDVNGVYASTDDGITWMARNLGIDTYGVSSIMRFQGYLYAGTHGGGVYRSSDEGQTWTPPSTGNTLYVTSLVANDPYIFAGAGSLGVYRSSDHGQTWTQVLPVFGVGAMCRSGNRVFASESNYTEYTTDNGVSWMNVEDLEGAIIFCYYCKGDTIFAGGQTKMYRSTDRGDNFTTININLGFGIVNIFAFSMAGSTLYAGTSYDGVYKSTDFGSTWIPSNQGMGPKDVRALTVGNSSTLLAGTHYVGMYRSSDSGASWMKSTDGFPAGSSIPEMLSVGTTILAGTMNDGLHMTKNNGLTWTKLSGTNDTLNFGTVRGICALDEAIYASFTIQFHTAVYKSADMGTTWVRSSNGLPADLTFIFGMATSGTNILAATDEGVFFSPDGGGNWTRANIPSGYVPGIAAGDGGYAYAVRPGVAIYRSANYGVDWSPSLQGTVDYIDVEAISTYAYAGSFFAGARYSLNSGSTWFASGGFPSDASVFALKAIGNGRVLAGTDLAPYWIYLSSDNGGNFQPYSEGLALHASAEAFTANDSFMFAGTDDNGVWRRLLPGLVSVGSQSDVPLAFSLDQNYPNPFNPTTGIRYQLPSQSKVTLKIYDLLGREVSTLVNETKPQGSYEVTWDASGVSSGVYFYRLQVGDFTQTRKLVLMK